MAKGGAKVLGCARPNTPPQILWAPNHPYLTHDQKSQGRQMMKLMTPLATPAASSRRHNGSLDITPYIAGKAINTTSVNANSHSAQFESPTLRVTASINARRPNTPAKKARPSSHGPHVELLRLMLNHPNIAILIPSPCHGPGGPKSAARRAANPPRTKVTNSVTHT